MLVIEERDLGKLLEKKYQEGIAVGVELMEQKMLSACENGSPVELPDGKAYFIKSDMQNLHDIFSDLETDKD